ncbi:hypothetical protein RFM98_17145 [Mesorhizobium sp. VK9D]|uniref:hypothetical protein n=1 Tax=Mesorhizobium australafricanum TaxID=3072311 RepID=UPI002A247C96|nr:hypothetical protein [Mesorhizobium sp. VK9D]MDX8454489.1 hypothetical protein [Mesorhizobium sp. VK9D]
MAPLAGAALALLAAVAVQGALFGIEARAENGTESGCDGDIFSGNLACGYGSHAYGSEEITTNATAVGGSSNAYGLYSSAFGSGAKAAYSGTAAGAYAGAIGPDAVAIGVVANAGGTYGSGLYNPGATAVGSGAQAGSTAANQANATAIGYNAQANASNATALGAQATASYSNSIAVGQGVTTERDNQVKIGQDGNTYTLSGINSAASKSAQSSGTKYLVTSDSRGNLATASVNIGQIEGLVEDVAQHTTQITSLNTTVGNHTTQLAGHEARITANTNALNLHTTQIASLDSRVTGTENNISALDGRVGALETGLDRLGSEIGETRQEARQGIAAAIAMANAPMPSAPGRTSWAANVGHFKGETAFGGSLTHRLDLLDEPFAVSLGYSYGGGDSHALRAGLMGEF